METRNSLEESLSSPSAMQKGTQVASSPGGSRLFAHPSNIARESARPGTHGSKPSGDDWTGQRHALDSIDRASS